MINWPPLEQHRQKNKRLILFYKAANNQSPVQILDYVQHPVRHSLLPEYMTKHLYN